ncbi:MAG: TSUP family transporter [Candidatus Nanohaloarchaea archaeon]
MLTLFVVATAAVFMGGLSKGFNGFGHALIATSLTATLVPAPQAVALVIPSLIAANTELVSGLGKAEAIKCVSEFRYYLAAALFGVTSGMLAIDFIPANLLKAAVGAFAVLYAASRLELLEAATSKLRNVCFKSHETGIGFLTGIVYGASNVALLAVSYLESRELETKKFRGVLAIVVLGLALYRLSIATALGLFTGPEKLAAAVALTAPALLGVKLGEKLSGRVPEKVLEKVSIGLIAVIGFKLLASF